MHTLLLAFLVLICGSNSEPTHVIKDTVHSPKVSDKLFRTHPSANAFEWSSYNSLKGGETYVGQKLELSSSTSIVVNSYTQANPMATVTLTKDVTYTMTTHDLTIKQVKFTPSTADKLESSLITATTGSLYLTMVTFEGITTASSALLGVIPQTMTSTLFKDITRAEITGGVGGSVFEIESDSSYIELSGASFDNCQCPKGKGGSIYIKVSDSVTNAPYIILSFSFKNVDPKAATSGLCTYIDYGQLSKEDISGESLTQLAPHKSGYHMFVAKDVTEPTNIYTFFESLGIFVDHTSGSASSASKDECGSLDKPCQTVATALESKRMTSIIAAAEDEEDLNLVILFALGEHSAETQASTIKTDMLFMGATQDATETVLSIASIGSSSAVFTIDAQEKMRVAFGSITFKASAASSTGVFLLKGAEETGYCKLSLSTVTFQNSEKTIAYSAPVIDARNGLLKLEEVTFQDITLTNCPLLRVNTGEDGLTCESVEFKTITRTSGNGALLEESITGTSSLSLGGFNYDACTATDGVGIFFFTVDKTATSTSFTWTLTSFSSTDQHDCLIGFKADDKAYVLDNLNFKTRLSESAIKLYYGVIGGKTLPLIYFTGHPSSRYYIQTGTDDSELCGWEELPCGPFKSWASKGTSFSLLEGKHEGTKLELSDSFYMGGTTDEDHELATTYTVTDGITFTSSSSLSLGYLIIAPADSFKAIKSHLIASTGSLTFYDVEFRDITLDGYCLISFTSLSCYSYYRPVLFKSISRSDTVTAGTSAASVFSIDASTQSIPLSQVKFDSCSGAKGGVGGAVFISFPADLDQIEMEVDVRPFTGSVSSPDEGKYIYFDASSVTAKAFLEEFEDELRALVADTTDHMFTVKSLKEAGKTDTEENELHKLLGITKLTLTVDTTSTGDCTKDATKCSSLSSVIETIENYGTAAGNEVTIASETLTPAQATFAISKGVSITGAPTKVVLDDSFDPYRVNEYTSALMSFSYEATSTLSKFNFELASATEDSALSTSVIAVSEDAQLTLSGTSFASSTASKQCYVSTSVISADSGKLILSSVSFKDITISSDYYSLLSINEEPGCFSISSTSTFSNIIKTSGSGSVLSTYLEQGDSVVIENAEFTSCKTPEGNGGALWFSIEGNGILTIKNCKFTSCEAGTVSKVQSNAERYGGAIYLDLKDKPTVTLASLTVSGCKASAKNGGNALFCSYYVDEGETVPESFWKDMMKGIEDPADGDYVSVVVHNGETPEDVDPINLSQYGGDDDDDGFPTWAIVLIVVVGVLIIAAVVVIIVVCVLRSKKAPVGVEDKTADGSASSPEEAPSDNALSE